MNPRKLENATMSDRLAKAFYESHGFVRPWDHPRTAELWHDACRRHALAFLVIMRDASSPQLEAAWEEGQRVAKECGGSLDRERFIHMIDRYYTAMIDAEILEQKQ